MPCDHVGPDELIAMAESQLRDDKIGESSWNRLRFRFGENLADGMWASVVTEVERRDGEWVVVRLDRSREALPESETGIRKVAG
jgi:hypothetical protein